MRKRTNLLKKLGTIVPSHLQPIVNQLLEEIRDFYRKLDILYHYNKNVYLFEAIYLEEKSNIEISNELPLDTKGITQFVKETEDFIRNVILSFEKYKDLISYVDKK